MSTRRQTHTQTESEPQSDYPPRTTPAETASVAATRTATDRAPRTFSRRNQARLENLIDEFNAAFASDSARGS